MSSLSQLFPSSGGGGGDGDAKRVEYLLVGGGGAAAANPSVQNGGGGGAGRVVHSNEEVAIAGITTWTINVGYGGYATDNPNYPTPTPNIAPPIYNGTPSSITNENSSVIATANGGGTAYTGFGEGPTIGSAGANGASDASPSPAPASVIRTSSTSTGEFVFYYDLGNPSGVPNAGPAPTFAAGGGGATEAGQYYYAPGGAAPFTVSIVTPTAPYKTSINYNKGGRGYYSGITGTGVTYGQGGDGAPTTTPTNPGVTQPFNTGWGASGGGSSRPNTEFYGGSPGVCVVRWRSPLGDAASVTGNDPTLPSTVNPGWYTYRFTTTSTSAGIGTISF